MKVPERRRRAPGAGRQARSDEGLELASNVLMPSATSALARLRANSIRHGIEGGSVGEVERWHLPSIEASGTREPRVLFSQPEFRGVVIDLNHGDELGDHRLYEHSVLQVVSGRLGVSGEDGEMECEAGTLLTFAPKETRSLRALEPSRILLVLAPWPGEGHFPDDREPEPERTRELRKSAEPPHD